MIQDKATREYTDKIRASVNRGETANLRSIPEPEIEYELEVVTEPVEDYDEVKGEDDTMEVVGGVAVILGCLFALWKFLSWLMP